MEQSEVLIGNMLETHWEIDWNNQNSKKCIPNPNSNTLDPPPKEKRLGPLGARWLTSLAAKNFYANMCSTSF
jgi:hypothetical protein